ncbi:MAG: CDGSH iron-sulfur domain-containing protein [Gammaproteobacteria bacterium]|nr:CDGSH iron-sulfur domain-containing protein [Gammaproteobacteria bacterium]
MASINTITVKVNGPLVCEGEITVLSAAEEVLLQDSEAYLCRCGASAKMPFCDGSHKKIQFTDAAEIHDQRAEVLETESGGLVITVKPDAMLMIKGPVKIQNKDGSMYSYRSRGGLCRCGASNNKPFCDASHKHCGFKD